MKKFIFKILLFSIPLFLVLLPPCWYLFQMKENFFDLESFIKNPSTDKYLIGYTYNEKNYKFMKWKYINAKPKFEIWSLGSSRAMQFRSEMFTASFYNAGFTVGRINEFLPFMKSIDHSKYPEMLIVTLDTWMFNTKYDKVDDIVDATKWTNSFKMYPSYGTLKTVWADMIDNKFSKNKTYAANGYIRIGYNANFKDTGFRNDGSFYYGEQIAKLKAKDSTCSDYNFKDTFLRIANGSDKFEHGNVPNSKAFNELEKFALFCKYNNIKMILVLPPFANVVLDKMISTRKYQYIQKIPEKCLSIAKKYKFECYDFTNPKKLKTNSTEFVDGFHGSEKVYLKMLVQMLEEHSVLNSKTNMNQLNDDLANSLSNYQVYQ